MVKIVLYYLRDKDERTPTNVGLPCFVQSYPQSPVDSPWTPSSTVPPPSSCRVPSIVLELVCLDIVEAEAHDVASDYLVAHGNRHLLVQVALS
jgi:hypothetical protein